MRIVIRTDGNEVSAEIHDGEAAEVETGAVTVGSTDTDATGTEAQRQVGQAGNGRKRTRTDDRFDRESATNTGGPPPELLGAGPGHGGEGLEDRGGEGETPDPGPDRGAGDRPPSDDPRERDARDAGGFSHPGVDVDRGRDRGRIGDRDRNRNLD
jgi:hypothetical protein